MRIVLKDLSFDNILLNSRVFCLNNNDTGIIIFKKQAIIYSNNNNVLLSSIVIDIDGWLPFCRRLDNIDDWVVEI